MNHLMDLPKNFLDLLFGAGILIGVIQCFFGYRLFKFILGVIGFIIGAAMCGAIGYAISGNAIVTFIAALIGGVIGAFVMIPLYFVGVFLIGSFLGGILGAVILGVLSIKPHIGVLIITGVIGGILAVFIQKFMIILSTSFTGAWNIIAGIVYFITPNPTVSDLLHFFSAAGSYMFLALLCWVALGITGCIVQFKSLPVDET
jgi:hypothetical protein